MTVMVALWEIGWRFCMVFLPVLEEVLQSLADGVPLLDGQQVLQLLSKGAALDPDTGR